MNNSQSLRGTSDPFWFKSSYSGTGGGECVEVAMTPVVTYVRDSKCRQGPILQVGAGEWTEFISFATHG
ncbi:DUF397 domain-containing protein [Streptomyces sp. NPDC058657]|uniref:DUF397 domain-containing protein n=1 Tax=unclassified Streptomyces TaxID=2593676 RepID=UPI00365DA7D6